MGDLMRRITIAALAGLICVAPAVSVAPLAAQEHNTLTQAERDSGWELLFDGHSLDGWRRYDGEPMTGGWAAESGTLTHSTGGRDIITEAEYTDFELTIEWKISEGGNSGLFYRAALGEEWVYHSAPEMQILDDSGHAGGQNPVTSAGSNYALHPAPRGLVHPVGEWNTVRLVVRGNAVEHWLNGTKIVMYEFGSPEWKELVAASKFSEFPAYGQAKSGHLGLQDHGNRVWFRDIKLRELR